MVDENDIIKLIDFGGAIREGLTPAERYRGTTCYAPPEVFKPGYYCPKATDVWSLGILLYTMLHGNPPVSWINIKMNEKISKATIDFMKWILKLDRRERPTIRQILDHEWLKK